MHRYKLLIGFLLVILMSSCGSSGNSKFAGHYKYLGDEHKNIEDSHDWLVIHKDQRIEFGYEDIVELAGTWEYELEYNNLTLTVNHVKKDKVSMKKLFPEINGDTLILRSFMDSTEFQKYLKLPKGHI